MTFSILIPSYKDTFLAECLDSCLSQTYSDYEIIVVNDSSPYDLDSIVEKFKNPKLHYYKNETGYGAEKLVDNWNHCLQLSSGDYVLCIGDDDKLKPCCLENYQQLIVSHPGLDVYHTRMEIIDTDSNVVTIQEERPTTESVFSMIWHFWHGRRQVIGDWCFKAETMKENGGFFPLPYAWSSDNLTAFKYAIKKGVANTNIPGFQYRESSITLTSKHTHSTIEGKIKAWKEVESWYKQFLQEVEATNDIDKIYKKNIAELLERYINRKIEGEIEAGIHDYPYSLMKWLKTGKTAGLSRLQILRYFTKNILF